MAVIGQEEFYFEPSNIWFKVKIKFTKRNGFEAVDIPGDIKKLIGYIGYFDTYNNLKEEIEKLIKNYTDLWKSKNKLKVIRIFYDDNPTFNWASVCIQFDYDIVIKIGQFYYKKYDASFDKKRPDIRFIEAGCKHDNFIEVKWTEEREEFLKLFMKKLRLLQSLFENKFMNKKEFCKLVLNKSNLLIFDKEK